MVFVPGLKTHSLTVPRESSEKISIILVIKMSSHDGAFSIKNLIELSLKKCLKDPKFSKPIPSGSLFDPEKMDQLKHDYLSKIQKEMMQGGCFERAVDSLKKKFIMERIGPLEILQPNEEVDEMPEEMDDGMDD